MEHIKSLKLPHVASRIFDTPLLIERSKLHTMLEYLSGRMEFELADYDGQKINYSAERDRLMQRFEQANVQFNDDGYYVVNGNTAIIQVVGSLIQRGNWMDAMSGFMSYDQISSMFVGAMNNPAIKTIVMEYDTPGGEVGGAFDLADMMVGARDSNDKAIIAVANEFAASGGYLLASTANEIVIPRTGAVGSVGVVTSHYDYSQAVKKKGVAVTFIYAGAKKVDGNPFAPLPDSVKAEWQTQINSIYDLFVSTVSRNLGIDESIVRGTEAGMFMGSKAVAAKLADRVNTYNNEVSNATLRTGAYKSVRQSTRKANTMDPKQEQEIKEKAQVKADAKVAAEAEARARLDAKGKPEVDAGQEERKRIHAIVNCEEAKERPILAQSMALETSMTVDEAKKLLAKAPKEVKASKLDEAMADKSPGISSQEPAGDPKQLAKISPQSVYANRAKQVQAARETR